MAERSLGVISTNGSGPVRATVNEADPAAPLWCNRYRLSHWGANNTGQAYTGTASMVIGSGDGVTGILPSPVGTSPTPMLDSLAASVFSQNVNMADVYIDADNQADSFLVSCIQV